MMPRSVFGIAAVGIVAVIFSGCGDEPPTAGRAAEAPSRDEAASLAEASWQAQIAAVREGRSDAIHIAAEDVTPARFQQLGDGCEGLTTLVIDDGSVDGGDLAVLSGLSKLRWLKLPGPVDDADLESIARCGELEILNLPAAVFTDSGCESIARLDRLMLLRFGSPHVTDQGIRAIAELPRLRFLHLLDVPIGDAALESVASIETLESFYLDGGDASDEGLRRLLAKRPDLHVHLDQTHIPGDPNAHD